MNRIAFPAAALLAALCSSPAAAQAGAPRPALDIQRVMPANQGPPSDAQLVTLEEAIDRALATSHRLAEAVARGDAAGAVASERHAALLPQLAGQAGYARTNHVDEFGILLPNNQLTVIYPDVPNNYRTRLDAQWPIYTAGRLDALERAARVEAAASADDLAAARADLRLETTRAYWALVTSIEALRVVEQSIARVDAHLRDVRNRLNVGQVLPSDVLNVEVQESRQRMLAIRAASDRDIAEADLVRLIGAAPGTRIQPASRLEPPALRTDAPAGGAGALSAALAQARQQRRERAGLVKRAEAAGERSTAAAAGMKPTVAVDAGVDYANPNPRIFPREDAWRASWDASISVNWSLFNGGRTRAEMAETAALRRAAAERLAEFDATLAMEVRQRLSEVEASVAAVAAGADAVRAAVEASRIIDGRFAAGAATSTDRLDAQVALLQADLDRTLAIANARLAEARLARALGR